MNRASGRVIATLAAVSATLLVATGALVDWTGSAAAALPESLDEPRRLDLGRAKTVLVCPGAPVLPDAGETDEDFEGDTAETQTRVTATGTPGVVLGGAVMSAPGADGVTTPPVPLEVVAGAETQSLSSEAGEAALVVGDSTDRSIAARVSSLRTSLTEGGDLRGLAATSCVAPASRSYLVGGGVEAGRSNLLMLSNPGRTTATVDLRVLTSGGPVEPTAGQDLAIAPQAVRELLVEALVPAEPVLAVEVVAEGGQVAATITDTQLQGVVPAGVEVLPATAATTTAVIPGVLAGSSEVSLRIAVPGSEPAVVGWRVEGADGPVVPAGEAVVSVQPGHVVDVPLEGLGGGPVNLVVESDEEVAVTAEVVAVPVPDPTGAAEGDDLARERAYAVPAPAITDSALLSVSGSPLRTHLELSSADTEALVTVSRVEMDGTVGDGVDVAVSAGAIAQVPYEVLRRARAVRLEVRSGTVHVAQVVRAAVPPRAAKQSLLFSIVPVTVPEPTQPSIRIGSPPAGRWP